MYFIFKNAKVHYEVFGSGKPLLFLHGWGGEISSFSRQIEYFSSTRKCIALDFPGFAASDEPISPMTVSDYAYATRELLKQLKIKSVDIIAHSFGGRVAFKLASLFPTLISSAVLVAPAGLKTRKRLKTKFDIFLYKLKRFLLRKGVIKNGAFLETAGSEDYKNLSPVMKKTFLFVVNEDLKKDVKSLKAPTLLVYGINDGEITPKTVKKLHKLIKSSDIMALFGGHFCYIEDCNRFNFAAERFFEGL